MPTTRRVVVAAALVLACSGCASGAGGNAALPTRTAGTELPPRTSATAAPTTTPSATADQADVLAVYRGWWTALQTAYATGDADDPALARFAVDPILGAQRASIRKLGAEGIVQRTTFTLEPRLRYRTDGNAEVEDCIRGPAGTYYDAATGRPRAPRGYRNDVPTEDRLLTTLQRRGAQWYVVATTGKGESEVAC
ncbi:MAG TPA: hypothetical protein VGP36_00360 [Mycobacteriales bacterium]|nr:hypothetical protein [Mycobacteriales bacterium]